MLNQSWKFKGESFRIIDTELLENGCISTVRVLQKKIDLKWQTQAMEMVPLEVSNNLLRKVKWSSKLEKQAKKAFGKPVCKMVYRQNIA